jgi:diguanylate cyclase
MSDMMPSIPVYAVDLAFALLFLAMGAAAGWWLFRDSNSESGSDGSNSERVLAALARVHELASSVAHDVGEHTSRVQEITTELSGKCQPTESGLNNVVVDTVAQVVEANERLQAQLRSAEERLKQQAAEIQTHASDARTDSLTRLNNRRAFDAELERRFAEWKRLQSPYSLFMVDVDHFKKFNDTYGHQAGDEVLKGVAHALRESMREMDVVCRYGGEEFAVILPATDATVAKQAAARALAAIEAARFRVDGTELNVTASIGMAEILVGEDNATLVKRADAGLYDSKKAGRNCAHYHDGTVSHPILMPAPVTPATKPILQTAEAQSANSNRQPIPRPGNTLEELSSTKILDSLPNQKTFLEELHRRVSEGQRFKVPLSLMLIHVDNFRSIATQYGSQVGDLVLDAVAQYLQVLIRDMDLLARYNNGQFCIMLPGSSMDDASRVAERIRNAISSCVIPIRESKLQLTICLGLAEMLPTDETNTLLERATEALHAARSIGPNQSQVHDGQQCQSLCNKAAAPLA